MYESIDHIGQLYSLRYLNTLMPFMVQTARKQWAEKPDQRLEYAVSLLNFDDARVPSSTLTSSPLSEFLTEDELETAFFLKSNDTITVPADLGSEALVLSLTPTAAHSDLLYKVQSDLPRS